MVTKGLIISGLRELGLGPGAILVVHSSLRSFGHVLGGAETVIRALQETVTPAGLVIMPVHSYSLQGRPVSSPYDPATTPGETGRVPELFRHLPGVRRSGHPTHSAAAWGGRAAEILADHERRGPVGRDSPLHRAALAGGQVLQLGVNHTTNTALHLAEVLADVPYLRQPYRETWGSAAMVRTPDGGIRVVEMVNGEAPGCSRGFAKIEPLLVADRLTREMLIGECRVRLTPLLPMIERAVAALRRDPGFLRDPGCDCEHCARVRQIIAARCGPLNDARTV